MEVTLLVLTRELRQAFAEMDHERIKIWLNELGGDWVWDFNPPSASHMGGVWERQIRSARNVLTCLMKTHSASLDDESLRTLMVETESIINSRPLTTETLSDAASPKPLCPSNLLHMKSNVVLPPPGEFCRADLYSRKRWRRVQHISNEFWNRWRKEVLASLQERKCWSKVKRNFQIGDIVLLKEDHLYQVRNRWPMARIIKVKSDSDGIVRIVTLKLGGSGGTLDRPISKIVLLLEHSV